MASDSSAFRGESGYSADLSHRSTVCTASCGHHGIESRKTFQVCVTKAPSVILASIHQVDGASMFSATGIRDLSWSLSIDSMTNILWRRLSTCPDIRGRYTRVSRTTRPHDPIFVDCVSSREHISCFGVHKELVGSVFGSRLCQVDGQDTS